MEDEKVSIDDLQAEIEGIEDYVQSTDVVSQFSSVFPLFVLTSPFPSGRNAETVVPLTRFENEIMCNTGACRS